MKLEEALKTGKKIRRKCEPHYDTIRWCKSETGPHKDLVGCSYFMISDCFGEQFSTSLDLYPNDIFADDWEVVE